MPKLTVELDKDTLIRLKALAFNDVTTEKDLIVSAVKYWLEEKLNCLTEHDSGYWLYLRNHGVKTD